MIWIVAVGVALVVAIAIYDLTQRQHAILRTFPIVGHFRGGAQAWQPDCRMPPEHGRRRRFGTPLKRRRLGVASGDGLLRLSRA